MVEMEEVPVQILYGELPVIPKASLPEDPRCSHLTTSVPGTTHRYLRRTPSERQVRTAASSSERISPHHRVIRPQSPCLGKAIQSQSRVHLCNAVVRVRHQRPATPALAGQSSSFSLLRPQSSPLVSFMQQDRQRVKLFLNLTTKC